jgi:hypothetical protein
VIVSDVVIVEMPPPDVYGTHCRLIATDRREIKATVALVLTGMLKLV